MNEQSIRTITSRYRRRLLLLVAAAMLLGAVCLLLGMVGPALLLPGYSVQAQDASIQAVTLDGSVSSNTGAANASSVAVAHTTGTGAGRLMLVGVSWNSGGTGRTVSSVQFGYGSGPTVLSLTEVVSRKHASQNRYAAIYRLLDPPIGETGTVTVTFSGTVSNGIVAGVANFAGVDQTTPIVVTNSADGNSTAPSVDLAGLAGDELAFDTVFQGGSSSSQTLTAGAGQSEHWNLFVSNTRAAGSTEQASSSSVTMSWTAASSSYWVIVAAAINPGVVGPSHDLTIAVAPIGGGTTNPSVGTHTYAENSTVTVTAAANVGYNFDQWTGDCSGSGDCVVTMDATKSVTATFVALPQYTLTATDDGNGSVSLDPAGPTYYAGTTVTLTVTPADCYDFSGWSGANSGDIIDTAGVYTILMDGNKSVQANFSALPQYTLTAGNDGNGSVTLDPAGGTYCISTTVTLTPVPNSGYYFDSWSGADSGDIVDTAGIYTILMNVTKTVQANFAVALWPTLDGAVSSGTADGASTLSFSHTTGTGANRLLMVGVSANSYNAAQTISSVTFGYDGTVLPLAEVGSVENEAGRLAAIWGVVNPPSGATGTVTVTFSGNVNYGIVGGAANFAGVNQATPFGTYASYTGTNTTPSVDVTTEANDLVFDTVFLGAATIGTLTPGAGQTGRWSGTIDRVGGAGSTEVAIGSSLTMSWTVSEGATSRFWAIGAVPIKPVAGVTCYTLTLGHSGNGADPVASPPNSSGCSTGEYVADESINLSGATPDLGWGIASWYGTSNNSITATSNSLVMPASAHTAGVNYLRLLGDVNQDGLVNSTDALIVLTADVGLDTSSRCPMNYGDVNGDGFVNSTDALIILTYDVGLPAGGYPLGQPVAEPSLTEQPPGCNPAPTCYLLNVNHTGDGTDPDPTPDNSVDCDPGYYVVDEYITLDATPDEGWEIGFWTGTDNDGWTTSPNYLTMPASDHSVWVDYAQTCYLLTVSHTGNGTDPDPSPANSDACVSSLSDAGASMMDLGHQYVYGEIITLDYATPDTGWEIGGWTGTDDDFSTTSPNYVTMPPNEHWVDVNYVQTCYLLTLGYTGDGTQPVADPTSSSGCDPGYYVYNEYITLDATPDTGWEIGGWFGTDDDLSTASPNYLTMPAIDHSVDVNYVQTCYELTLSHTPLDGGGTDPTPLPGNSAECDPGYYVAGEYIELTAYPDTGWVIDSWYGTVDPGTNSLTMPADNHTAGVNYVLQEDLSRWFRLLMRRP